jgi:hypothetical protein
MDLLNGEVATTDTRLICENKKGNLRCDQMVDTLLHPRQQFDLLGVVQIVHMPYQRAIAVGEDASCRLAMVKFRVDPKVLHGCGTFRSAKLCKPGG